MNWNLIKCGIFGHIFHTHFINHIETNVCTRCGYKNMLYDKQGYYFKSED